MKILFCILLMLASTSLYANTSILDFMSEADKDALLKKYIDRESNLKEEKRIRDIISSSDSEQSKVVIDLIKSGDISPGHSFRDNLSILEFSSLMGNFDVASYLLKNTDQNKSVKQHSLELACANKYTDLVELFIAAGVDINVASSNGNDWLCIFSSIKNFDYELFDLLTKKGVDLSVRNSAGYTPKKYLDSLKSSAERLTIK